MRRKQIHVLTPRQPFLAMHTDTYKKIVVEDAGISHFYEFTVNGGTPPDVQAVPDGSVDLLFSISGHDIRTVIGGTVLKVKKWPIDEQRLHFGVRFQPGECVLPAGLSIKDVVNADIELDTTAILGEDYVERLASCRDARERALCFLRWYAFKAAAQSEQQDPAHRLEFYLRSRIYESRGNVTIQELAQETGYSECYIRRIFNSIHGISPKVFERFVRFQNALDLMRRRTLTLEQTALECGYYDQSHMVKDFKSFSGVTPERYQSIMVPVDESRI